MSYVHCQGCQVMHTCPVQASLCCQIWLVSLMSHVQAMCKTNVHCQGCQVMHKCPVQVSLCCQICLVSLMSHVPAMCKTNVHCQACHALHKVPVQVSLFGHVMGKMHLVVSPMPSMWSSIVPLSIARVAMPHTSSLSKPVCVARYFWSA